VTLYEWALIAVLALVPVVLIVSRRMRRHAALLWIIWLLAIIGWIFLTEHQVINCLLHGQLCS
jgi:hypothetical protein